MRPPHPAPHRMSGGHRQSDRVHSPKFPVQGENYLRWVLGMGQEKTVGGVAGVVDRSSSRTSADVEPPPPTPMILCDAPSPLASLLMSPSLSSSFPYILHY